MTLREFLVKQQIKYLGAAISRINGLDKEYYKSLGKVPVCTDFIDLLSDDTLNMEVETRVEASAKAKKKDTACCRCSCPFLKGE